MAGTRSSARLLAASQKTAAPDVPPPPPPAKKKTKYKKEAPKKKAIPKKAAKPVKAAPAKKTDDDDDDKKKTVSIEACKQWNAFQTRAKKIANAVGDSATVVINDKKPGRGNFVVRVDDGEPIVELLGLKRPFPPLKALDMEKVSNQVLEALK